MLGQVQLDSEDFTVKPDEWYGITSEFITRVKEGAARRYELYQEMVWGPALQRIIVKLCGPTPWPPIGDASYKMFVAAHVEHCDDLRKEVATLRELLHRMNFERQRYVRGCDRLVQHGTITQEQLDDALLYNTALFEYLWTLGPPARKRISREQYDLRQQEEAST